MDLNLIFKRFKVDKDEKDDLVYMIFMIHLLLQITINLKHGRFHNSFKAFETFNGLCARLRLQEFTCVR
jgi:hypothetical protein